MLNFSTNMFGMDIPATIVTLEPTAVFFSLCNPAKNTSYRMNCMDKWNPVSSNKEQLIQEQIKRNTPTCILDLTDKNLITIVIPNLTEVYQTNGKF